MPKPKVLVTLDSMKDINCGYYSFGKGLGDALIEKNKERFKFTFYLFDSTRYFDNKADILRLSTLDKIFFPARNNFDVVHFSDQTCRLNPGMVNAKKIMTIHDMNKVHLKFSKPYRIRVYLKRLEKVIDKCDKIVAISKFVANDVLHYFPQAKDKLTVIYNGADKLVLPAGHLPAYLPR